MLGSAARRRKLAVVAGVLLLGAAAAAWRAFDVTRLARIGTGYAAQQTCACLFVAGRGLQSCLTDLDPLARRLTWLRAGDAEVSATAFGLASAKARFENGFGCSLAE